MNVSLSAGEPWEHTFNVTLQAGWNTDNMGVVAWLQSSLKNSDQRFRPHESFQAADSRASQACTPTPTPTPPHTPTPPDQPTNTPDQPTNTPDPAETATPTPTPPNDEFYQKLNISHDVFYPGHEFNLSFTTQNPTNLTYYVDQYLLLEIATLYFFWPAWSEDLSYEYREYQPGYNDTETIFNFTWPGGAGTYMDNWFYLATFDAGTFNLSGNLDMVKWGYAE